MKILNLPNINSTIRHRIVECLIPARERALSVESELTFLWPVSDSVGKHRFEDLFEPIPDVNVQNIFETNVLNFEVKADGLALDYCGESYSEGEEGENILLRDACPQVTFDFNFTPLPLKPGERMVELLAILTEKFKLNEALGIRIKKSVSSYQCLTAVLAMKRETRTFIMTDDADTQKTVCAHFKTEQFSPMAIQKQFPLDERNSITNFMYVLESFCLNQCKDVIDIGGHLLDWKKPSLKYPYLEYRCQ